ncbi:(2Fe-2S)-binding protein [Streptomyces radicis]|uniref:(2Fe-2S)-binding protein n=1 Tax=Streptomyces radicis TaxID=1750517 RepID=A0A3A9WKU1_9ACTN|nr:(2Fe-2S)-binding protein [Streptomyces radicis]RKN08356.1 (2Fe-2S)-binding protein [Streptomyces radicis]RKN21608.1 (2Fe-2S)-binding protein [Streptomyces radicis]
MCADATAGPPAPPDVLAALGPFFAVERHPVGAVPATPWRPLAELTEDPGALSARVAEVRASLAASHGAAPERVEPRVAASVAHLGLVARLVSPALALAVLRRAPFAASLGALWWRPVLGGPVPLSVAVEHGGAAAGRGPAELLRACLDRGPVGELTAAFGTLSLSPRILWGNVASAVHGAAAQLARARPGAAGEAGAALGALLPVTPLRGMAEVGADGRFLRRSCCLIYRAAPDRRGPVCGDCVLARS